MWVSFIILWEKVGCVMARTPPRTDDRLEKVEEITISFETFKKALKRNYLGERHRRDRSYVLRLYPPFEAEMEAEYYESEQGRHYDSNWNEKPFHIPPELLILEGTERGFRGICEWPTEANTRHALSEEEIEEDGGIEKAVEIGREVFWDEVKHDLPETFNLGRVHGVGNYTVELNWEE